MRPLTVLLGIIMGSAVSIAVGLAMVLIVYLVLAGDYAQLREEFGPLLRSLALFVPLSAIAAAGFIGQLRQTRWRRIAAAATWCAVLLIGWVYWPKS